MKKKSNGSKTAEIIEENVVSEVMDELGDKREEEDNTKVTFKKVLHGYSIDEVDEYIEGQNTYHASTCSMYDEKLNEMRSEIMLLNRERESLISKNEILQEEFEQYKLQVAQNSATVAEEKKEDDIVIEKDDETLIKENDSLRSQIVALKEENAALLNEKEITLEKLEELENLKLEKEELENEILSLNSNITLNNAKIRELSAKEADLEHLTDEFVSLNKQYNDAVEKRNGAEKNAAIKAEQLAAAESEQNRLRQELSDFEIRYALLRQQLKKSDEDLDELRKAGKQQAYDYANKVSEMQADLAAEKIKLKKQVQFHLFHINQLGSLLDEVKKEYGEAVSSLDGLTDSDNSDNSDNSVE